MPGGDVWQDGGDAVEEGCACIAVVGTIEESMRLVFNSLILAEFALRHK